MKPPTCRTGAFFLNFFAGDVRLTFNIATGKTEVVSNVAYKRMPEGLGTTELCPTRRSVKNWAWLRKPLPLRPPRRHDIMDSFVGVTAIKP